MKLPAALVLMAALLALLVARGIVPAASKIDSDFPNYLTSAKVVAEGGDAARLYDNDWFHEQMRRYHIGTPPAGKFAPFPPPTALLLVPLADLEPLDAMRVVTCISVLCLIACIVFLARALSWSALDTSVFVLLSGYNLYNCLRDGQPYVAASLACIAGYYARLVGRPALAGACFGLFVPIKYFPVVYLLYFAWRREWRLVLAGAAVVFIIGSTSILVLGWKVHEIFLTTVLGEHLTGVLSMQDPFTATFQSFDSLFRRLFVFDAAANPHPWLASRALQVIGLIVTKGVIAALTVAALLRLRRAAPDEVAPALGILGIAALLLAPATASYHMLLLWLPLALVVNDMIRRQALLPAACVVAMYASTGFFPVKLVMPFEGRGGLSLLAYPRLLLLLGIFIVSLRSLWRREDRRAAAT